MSQSKSTTRVCVPICESRADQVPLAITAAEKVGNVVEIRFDCLSPAELEKIRPLISGLIEHSRVPLIFTLRPEEEGGRQKLTAEVRKDFWATIPSGDFFTDVELRLLTNSEIELDWSRVICSMHDFNGIPANLDEIYEGMSATRAGILKIAVQANDVTDCLPIFEFLKRSQREGREMIAIAMGDAGIATRVLGPSRGSFLTYGALEADKSTAPGQITAEDLRDLYHIERITESTLITGLVGLPVTHSFSPYLHNAAFAATKVDGVYLPFAVRDFDQFMRRMVKPATREIDWNLRGLSITAPFKASALKYLDWADVAVREIGAVNTLVIEGEEVRGYNTDAAAFLAPLMRRRAPLTGTRCAVLGSGGAARTAAWALLNEGANVTVFARDAEKANLLARQFNLNALKLAGASFDEFDVVINATPLGTRGSSEAESIVTSGQLRGAGLAYDLVYNPSETMFLREAKSVGCETIGGLEMLLTQAMAQFELWTGHTAPQAVMEAAAERAVKRFNGVNDHH